MNNWKIIRIRLYNFKGFEDKEISLDESLQAIILGGKNGFGKTTIFDAIELVLTGSIQRYQRYSEEYVYHRTKKDTDELPLVFDAELLKVQIDLEIAWTHDEQTEHYILSRFSETSAMKNPVDFSAFSKLYYRTDISAEEMLEVDDERLSRWGIDELCRHYQVIHYLSQEEAISFLKQKETDRAGMINTLFDTAFFDEKMQKIKEVLDELNKNKIDTAKKELKSVEENLQIISQNYSKESVSQQPIPYRKLFEEIPVNWDQENPALNLDAFNEVLKGGGLMDNLLYLCQHYADFAQWKKNGSVQTIESQISNLAFYVHYLSQEKELQLLRKFYKSVEEFKRLSLPRISSFSLPDDMTAPVWVSDEVRQAAHDKLILVQNLYQNESAAQKIYSDMLTHRHQLASVIEQQASGMDIKQCPLCGQNYESVQELLIRLKSTEDNQKSLVEGMKQHSAQAFQDFVQFIHQEIIQVVLSQFAAQNLTIDIAERFTSIVPSKMNQMIEWIQRYGDVSIVTGNTLNETEAIIQKILDGIKADCNSELDYTQMDKTFQQYYRHIPKEKRQISILQEKRAYLLQAQLHTQHSIISSLNQKKDSLEDKLKQYQLLKNKLTAFKNTVKNQKESYLKHIIDDIEILFYIYSGRIMQDCYFGRGLFMKNTDSRYVQFVSQYHSDVDALFNMSSGQLVVVALAFLMALNKLYAKVKFLAIDDPIQTIDDMNLWGFIETLRHEFKDTTLLMSTHEPDYGGLLRYKLSKMQIPAIYVDMKDIRYN